MSEKTIIEGALILDGFFENESLWEKFASLLEEIETFPKSMPWNGLSSWKIDVSVHRKKNNEEIIPPLRWDIPAISKKNRASAALIFTCKPSHPKSDLSFDYDCAECLFQDFAKSFIFIANISHPGCFSVLSITIRNNDGAVEEYPGFVPHFDGALRYIHETGWPELIELHFIDVYRWVYSNGFHVRSGDSPISRAFNAFTWLFGEVGKDNPFSLVSTLLGIEALFSTNSSDVTEQVRHRAQLLLGERTSFKKDLTKMYAARSSFIHGQTLLSPNGYSWGPPEETLLKMEKTYNGQDIANAVLLASLQRLATNNWNSLEYQEKVVGFSNDDSSYIEETTKGINIPMLYVESIDKWIEKYTKIFE